MKREGRCVCVYAYALASFKMGDFKPKWFLNDNAGTLYASSCVSQALPFWQVSALCLSV